MNIFLLLLVIAVISETIWERVKNIFLNNLSKELKKTINLIGTSVLGIVLAFITDVDIFPALGFNENSHLAGIILTGIIAGGGSNYVHKLMKRLGDI